LAHIHPTLLRVADAMDLASSPGAGRRDSIRYMMRWQ